MSLSNTTELSGSAAFDGSVATNFPLTIVKTITPTWTGKHTFSATVPAIALKAGAATLGSTNYFLMTNTDPAAAAVDVVAASKSAFLGWIGDAPSSGNGAVVPVPPGVASGILAQASVTGGAIGTGDFTVAVKLRWPATNPAASSFICAVSSSGTGVFNNDFGAYITTSGGLVVFFRDGSAVLHPSSTVTMTAYSGRVIDIVFTRATGVMDLYINGEKITYTPPDNDDISLAGGATTLFFKVLSQASANAPFPDAFYAGRFFNKTLTATEIANLGRYGVSAGDQWGTLSPVVAGALIDLDLGATCGTIVPNRSPSGDATLTGTVEVVDSHLHCIGDIVSSQAMAVPFVGSNRLTADATKLTWDGALFKVYGNAHVQSAAGIGIVPTTASWL